MTKGQLNLAAAELQQKINKLSVTRDRALTTAQAAVDRKYKKQIQELLDSKFVYTTDGENEALVYPQEVVTRVESPEFWTLVVQTELLTGTNDDIEDLEDNEAIEIQQCAGDLPDENGSYGPIADRLDAKRALERA